MNLYLFKKLYVFIFTIGFVTSAQAALIDYGNGMIYDDELDLTMLQDMNYAMTSGYDADGHLTWQEAVVWADQLTFGGFTDWRLPSVEPCYDFNHLCTSHLYDPSRGELAHIYEELGGSNPEDFGEPGWTPPDLSIFDNVLSGRYWAGPEFDQYNEGYPTHAWWYSLTDGAQDAWPIDIELAEHVWAVRNGSPIPIPGALWLFVTGLLGMLGIARFKTKH